MLIILGLGRLIIRPLMRFVGATNTPEVFMAVTLLIIIATAAATHAVGLSAALGAFLAGLLLAESEYRHEVEVNIEPFKGLLLGLFFMSVGMSVDLAAILNDPLWIVLAIVGLFLIRGLVLTLVARLFNFGWAHAIEMGFLLSQGGEFAFVVLGMALGFSLLPVDTAQFMLIVVSATMFLTPLMTKLGQAIATGFPDSLSTLSAEEVELPNDLTGHVVVVGYGRTGQLVTNLLNQQQVPFLVLDLDAQCVNKFRGLGVPIQLGDASRSAVLKNVLLEKAAALVVCTDDPGATEQVLRAAQQAHPHTPIIARARDMVHGKQLLALGSDRVVPELLESGLQLSQVMFEELGLSLIHI